MREGPIKVRLLIRITLCPTQHTPENPRPWRRAVETSDLERVGLIFSITEFDTNCYPIRVPCSRWSWMTTWDWKSSLRLEWSQFPPARETTHQSRRCALSAPAAVLFPSHAAGDASYIPSLSPSDILSVSDVCFLQSPAASFSQPKLCWHCGSWDRNWKFRLSLPRSGLLFWIVLIWKSPLFTVSKTAKWCKVQCWIVRKLRIVTSNYISFS